MFLGIVDSGLRKFLYCLGFLLGARQNEHGIVLKPFIGFDLDLSVNIVPHAFHFIIFVYLDECRVLMKYKTVTCLTIFLR